MENEQHFNSKAEGQEESQPFLIGYRCPRCGNEIGYETIVIEQIVDDPVLCARCEDEYTTMEPIYEN